MTFHDRVWSWLRVGLPNAARTEPNSSRTYLPERAWRSTPVRLRGRAYLKNHSFTADIGPRGGGYRADARLDLVYLLDNYSDAKHDYNALVAHIEKWLADGGDVPNKMFNTY